MKRRILNLLQGLLISNRLCYIQISFTGNLLVHIERDSRISCNILFKPFIFRTALCEPVHQCIYAAVDSHQRPSADCFGISRKHRVPKRNHGVEKRTAGNADAVTEIVRRSLRRILDDSEVIQNGTAHVLKPKLMRICRGKIETARNWVNGSFHGKSARIYFRDKRINVVTSIDINVQTINANH